MIFIFFIIISLCNYFSNHTKKSFNNNDFDSKKEIYDIVKELDYLEGDGAGIKSVTFSVSGDNSYDFSYSGLKTSVINLANQLKMKGEELRINDMAKSFQDVAIGMVVDKATKAARNYNVKQVILAGGVSANSYLRETMKNRLEGTGIDLIIPPLWCTTDNAAMIAKVAERLYKLEVFAPLSLGVDPNWKIDDYRNF